ncbi:hypothetical protein BC827DRAFT_1229774 [Russula dissimulans]|nr:hypothetical protein BC827DRAFT_1229774 [Russula dissimulans]
MNDVMARIVQRSDWLEEETANIAREALRTHVAIVRVQGCNEAMATVVADTLEHDFELLGLTGRTVVG